jgi:excisionase family DNA binding protein
MRPDEDIHHRPNARPTAVPMGRLTAADVMTGREVAALLHAPVSTVEDWARRNILPSVKIGRRRLYIRWDVEAVLTRRTPTH